MVSNNEQAIYLNQPYFVIIPRSSAFGRYLITLYADVADNIEFSIHACDQCHGETSIQDYELMYDFLVDYLRLEVFNETF